MKYNDCVPTKVKKDWIIYIYSHCLSKTYYIFKTVFATPVLLIYKLIVTHPKEKVNFDSSFLTQRSFNKYVITYLHSKCSLQWINFMFYQPHGMLYISISHQHFKWRWISCQMWINNQILNSNTQTTNTFLHSVDHVSMNNIYWNTQRQIPWIVKEHNPLELSFFIQ